MLWLALLWDVQLRVNYVKHSVERRVLAYGSTLTATRAYDGSTCWKWGWEAEPSFVKKNASVRTYFTNFL